MLWLSIVCLVSMSSFYAAKLAMNPSNCIPSLASQYKKFQLKKTVYQPKIASCKIGTVAFARIKKVKNVTK